MKKNLSEKLYHVFCGAVMGAADMIPGVSGGTMALVLGIYPRLVAAMDVLKAPFARDLANGRVLSALGLLDWALLLPLMLGLVLAIAAMVKLLGLPELLRDYPQYVYALFFGLILGSIPLLLRQGEAPKHKWLWLALGGAAGFALTQLVPAQLPDSATIYFASGAVAICAMLLPGVSGSYLLLILGKYETVISALDSLDFAVIAPFLAGCLAGLILFSKALNWLLRRYRNIMMWCMAGLLIGSLPKVWPFQAREFALVNGKEKLVSSELYWPEIDAVYGLAVAGLMLLGVFMVIGISYIQSTKKPASLR